MCVCECEFEEFVYVWVCEAEIVYVCGESLCACQCLCVCVRECKIGARVCENACESVVDNGLKLRKKRKLSAMA